MRSALLVLPVVLLVAGAGYAICLVAGWDLHARSLVQAAATCVVATGAAFIPLVLSRGAAQATVAQAALIGTLVHLFGCAVGALVMILVQGLGLPAVCWMFAFYTATLATLVVSMSRAVRSAPAGGAATQ